MTSENSKSSPIVETSVPPWKRELLLRKKTVSRERAFERGRSSAEDFQLNNSSDTAMRLLTVKEPGDLILHSRGGLADAKLKRVDDRNVKISSLRGYNKLRADYINSTSGKDEFDSHSDSSEELQYGPGIVNKLRSKYLSMTLRNNQKHSSRPSLANLRRATSLENMLDDAEHRGSVKSNFIKKHYNLNGQKCGRVSQQQAKYLGISKGESMKRARSMETLFKNEAKPGRVNGTIQSHGGANDELVIVERDEVGRLLSFKVAEDKELPPPDVVKQTKKIFEMTSSQLKTEVKLSRKFILNNLPNNVKVGEVFERPAKLVKPQLSPKPTHLGDKRENWPQARLVPVVTTSPAKAAVVVSSLAAPRVVGLEAKPVVVPRVPSVAVPPVSPLRVDDESSLSDGLFDHCQPESTPAGKSIVDSSLSSCFPRRNLMQATNPCLINSTTLEQATTVKQVAVIRPIPAKKPPLTDQEVENNLINAVKSVQKRIDQVDTVQGDAEQVQSWRKKTWQSANTMVFDFSSRPSVPDYIENDGRNVSVRVSGTKRQHIGCRYLGGEDEDEEQTAANISFDGANVIINGKSSMKKEPHLTKVKRIQFDDEATTLYEYPSEDSLVEEDPATTEPALASPRSLLDGAALSRYTPSKSAAPAGFELGVTSTAAHTPTPPSTPDKLDDYLKPVDINQETTWSQETTSDILF